MLHRGKLWRSALEVYRIGETMPQHVGCGGLEILPQHIEIANEAVAGHSHPMQQEDRMAFTRMDIAGLDPIDSGEADSHGASSSHF